MYVFWTYQLFVKENITAFKKDSYFEFDNLKSPSPFIPELSASRFNEASTDCSLLLSGLIQDKASISVITEIVGVWSKTSAIKSIPFSVKFPEKKFEITLFSTKYCPIPSHLLGMVIKTFCIFTRKYTSVFIRKFCFLMRPLYSHIEIALDLINV